MLFLGHDRQLADYFLKPCPALFIGAGGHRGRILLGGKTIVHVTDIRDFTSQGHNVSQHIGGVHTYQNTLFTPLAPELTNNAP
jgi:hypothetical protein